MSEGGTRGRECRFVLVQETNQASIHWTRTFAAPLARSSQLFMEDKAVGSHRLLPNLQVSLASTVG